MSGWTKVLSLRYRSMAPITTARFDQLIDQVGQQLGQPLENSDNDYLFTVEIEGVPCVGAVVLFDASNITECQLTILTQSPKKPADLTQLDPVHQLIEACFVAT